MYLKSLGTQEIDSTGYSQRQTLEGGGSGVRETLLHSFVHLLNFDHGHLTC